MPHLRHGTGPHRLPAADGVIGSQRIARSSSHQVVVVPPTG
jgi:hypothetical protein